MYGPNPTNALQESTAITRLKKLSTHIDLLKKTLPSMQDPNVSKEAVLLQFQNTLLDLQEEVEEICGTLEPPEKPSVEIDTEHFPQI